MSYIICDFCSNIVMEYLPKCIMERGYWFLEGYNSLDYKKEKVTSGLSVAWKGKWCYVLGS